MIDNVIFKSLFLGVFAFFLFTFVNSSIIVKKLNEERKFIVIDGVTVSYKEAGKEHIENGTIIFLHGFSGSANDWDFLIQEVSKSYYCIAIDIPPFGLSEKSLEINYSNQNTLNLLVNAIKYLTSESSIEKFVLVGHSMGGNISIKLTNYISEKIEKIILIDAAYNISNENSQQFSLSQSEAKNLSVLLDVGLKIYPLVKWVYYSSLIPTDIVYTNHFDKLFSQNFFLPGNVLVKFTLDKQKEWQEQRKLETDYSSNLSELRKIEIPTLIIYGEKDTVTPPQIGEFLNKNLRNSEFILIPNEGHMPLANKVVISKIVEFLNRK